MGFSGSVRFKKQGEPSGGSVGSGEEAAALGDRAPRRGARVLAAVGGAAAGGAPAELGRERPLGGAVGGEGLGGLWAGG